MDDRSGFPQGIKSHQLLLNYCICISLLIIQLQFWQKFSTISCSKNVDHVYYTSKIYSPTDTARAELWVDFSERQETWRNHGFLPNLQRNAERVRLSFDFPFYGHPLKEVTVASGGFIYTGEVMHQLLTATQYIAPLMANFDPSLSTNSSVFYFDNGTALVVQWGQVLLQDNSTLGRFTFQAALHKDGRILFTYKQIPVDVSLISTEHHPVRVGLSDAFVVLHEIEQIPNVRRKTIYEYHKVDILKSKISSCTAVEMFPLPTCLQFSSCGACVSSQIGFNCSWCSQLQRCSSGFDRKRQDWVDHGCLDEVCTFDWIYINLLTPALTECIFSSLALPKSKSALTGAHSLEASVTPHLKVKNYKTDPFPSQAQVGLVVGVAVGTVVIAAAVLLSMYVYIHPTSNLSLFLIERRPSRWPILRFRRGSGRPSYADVELSGHDGDCSVVIDPKQAFIISDRRESEQKEGFVVPDQRERFHLSENS
uniref:Si:ch211-106h4.6 n=1 Tax=Neogobius melanostomus TaxID=47308 RepID=A0A8C6TFB9_9GOBI